MTTDAINIKVKKYQFYLAKVYYAVIEHAETLDSPIPNYVDARNFLYRKLSVMDLTNGFDFEKFKEIW